jgi:hypothetical protein
MSGAIPALRKYAFMAWCLVKAQGQFTCNFIVFTILLLTAASTQDSCAGHEFTEHLASINLSLSDVYLYRN